MKYLNDIGGVAGQILIAATERLDQQYSKGEADFSVTELLDDAHYRRLHAEHAEQIVKPISMESYRIDGQIVHRILEEAAITLGEKMVVPEKRLFHTFDVPDIGPVTVSGQFDTHAIVGNALGDWKNTSRWVAMQDEPKPAFVQQLNLLNLLAAVNGIHIESLEVHIRMRDWSATQTMSSKDYPPAPYAYIPIPMWSHADAANFLYTRIAAHINARVNGSSDCTPEGRWAREATYAVMTDKLKKASKVSPTRQEALAWAETHPDKRGRPRTIVERPGLDARCQRLGNGYSYCPVTQWCARGRKAHSLRDNTHKEKNHENV